MSTFTHWVNSNLFASLLSAVVAVALPVIGSYWALNMRVGRLEVHIDHTRQDLRELKGDVSRLRDDLRRPWSPQTTLRRPSTTEEDQE